MEPTHSADSRRPTRKSLKPKTLLLLLACILNHFAWGSDTPVSFHGSKLRIPSGFHELSKDQLSLFKSAVFDRAIMTVYEKSDAFSGLQRIIVFYDSLTGTKNLTFEKIAEIKREVLEEDGTTLNGFRMNALKHCAFGKIILQGDTSLFGFSVDEFGIMSIQYDNSTGIRNSDMKIFERLLTAIKHRSPYKYAPEESAEVREAKEEMEYHGMNITLALVLMVCIWLIRKYALKKKT